MHRATKEKIQLRVSLTRKKGVTNNGRTNCHPNSCKSRKGGHSRQSRVLAGANRCNRWRYTHSNHHEKEQCKITSGNIKPRVSPFQSHPSAQAHGRCVQISNGRASQCPPQHSPRPPQLLPNIQAHDPPDPVGVVGARPEWRHGGDQAAAHGGEGNSPGTFGGTPFHMPTILPHLLISAERQASNTCVPPPSPALPVEVEADGERGWTGGSGAPQPGRASPSPRHLLLSLTVADAAPDRAPPGGC